MRYYNDVIHGRQIKLSAMEEAFIDHPALLQLSGKKQLGLTCRIYRNATHSRYEHSIGAMFVAGRIAEHLGLSEDDKKLLQAAAALHDIGHYPFSHAAESVMPLHHEQIPQIVLRGQDFGAIDSKALINMLRSFGVDPLAVADVLAGKHPLYPLISNSVVDADRLDYLPRDLHMCNVAFGADIDRIIEQLTFKQGKVGIDISGVSSITGFLVARALAYDQIYLHPKAQIGETMLLYAVEHEPSFTDDSMASRIHAMAEPELLDLLSRSEDAFVSSLAKKVRGPVNEWYKTAYSLGGEISLPLVKQLYAHRKELEEECLRQGLLVTWFITDRVVKERQPPHFPISDGTALFDRAIPKAAFEHVPDNLFAIYGPTGSDEEKRLAEKIVVRFA